MTPSRPLPARSGARGVILREDAERLVEEILGDDPEIAAKLRIEERELEVEGPC